MCLCSCHPVTPTHPPSQRCTGSSRLMRQQRITAHLLLPPPSSLPPPFPVIGPAAAAAITIQQPAVRHPEPRTGRHLQRSHTAARHCIHWRKGCCLCQCSSGGDCSGTGKPHSLILSIIAHQAAHCSLCLIPPPTVVGRTIPHAAAGGRHVPIPLPSLDCQW